MTPGSAVTAKPPSWWHAASEPAIDPVPVPVPAPAPEPVAPVVDDQEERAALVADGAEAPQAWAEGFAGLRAMPPPAGFWPERWQRIIDASGVFLDRWAGEAIRCGWSDLDV